MIKQFANPLILVFKGKGGDRVGQKDGQNAKISV